MLSLHRPIDIAGQTVVLLDDLALSGASEKLRAGLLPIPCADPDLSLYTAREPVEKMASSYPSVPLYGLWQVLIASGQVPKAPSRCRIDLDTPPGGSRYLVREGDSARSGWIVDEGLEDVAGQPADLASFPRIEYPLGQLRLPETPIRSHQHLLQQQRQARRRALLILAPALSGCLLLGLSADHLLHLYHTDVQERLTLRIEALGNERERLNAWTRIRALDQSHRLDSLMRLARYPLPFEIPATSLQEEEGIPTLLRGTEHLPPFLPIGLRIRQQAPQPDGSVRILW